MKNLNDQRSPNGASQLVRDPRAFGWPWPGGWAGRVALATLAVACGCAPKALPVLRVGMNPWPGYEFLHLAQQKGFYKDEGLEVRLVDFSSLADCRRAYERGQLDAMGSTVIEVLMVRDQSARSPQIVQVVDYSAGADVILAQPGLKTGADLRGARIGVELASLGVYVLARGLEKSGLTFSDVKAISMDQVSMEDAFRKGELDAVVTYPPTSIKLLADTQAHPVFSTAEIAGEVLDVLVVEEEVIRQRPGDVGKFLKAFQRAVAYASTNPADAYRIMAANEGISPEEFARALTDGMKLLTAADQAAYFQRGGPLATVIDATDRILRQGGQIKGPDRRAGIGNPVFFNQPSQP